MIIVSRWKCVTESFSVKSNSILISCYIILLIEFNWKISENKYNLQQCHFLGSLAFGLGVLSFCSEGGVTSQMIFRGFFPLKAAHVKKRNTPKLELNDWN